MKLYQSSQPLDAVIALGYIFPDIKVNVLRTFADPDEANLEIAVARQKCLVKSIGSLILDSGTFSINSRDKMVKPISLDAYRIFLKTYDGLFDYAFNYDEHFGEGGATINFSNQLFLEKNDCRVIPVIQDFNEVDFFCKNKDKYQYVAIGSGCRGRNNDKARKEAVRKLNKEGIKVHLFAEGSYAFMKDIPVYSSDCKSCIDWTRIRQFCYFDTKNNKEIQMALDVTNKSGELNKKYYQTNKYAAYADAYESWLAEHFGWSIPDLNIGDRLLIANSYYFYELEQRLTKEHNALGFIY